MKTINTISDTIGYTIDSYTMFSPSDAIADDDWTDDTEIDGAAYVAELANHCAEILERACSDAKFKAKFTATGSYSPSYYNFSTDNAELLISFDDAKVLAYIYAHLVKFSDYLKENFTSYDGFSSFVPNNWTEFSRGFRTGDTIEADRNWAIMLGWYMRESEILTLDDYIDAMNDHVSEAAYNHATNLAEEE
jgi:hypothetical protein